MILNFTISNVCRETYFIESKQHNTHTYTIVKKYGSNWEPFSPKFLKFYWTDLNIEKSMKLFLNLFILSFLYRQIIANSLEKYVPGKAWILTLYKQTNTTKNKTYGVIIKLIYIVRNKILYKYIGFFFCF